MDFKKNDVIKLDITDISSDGEGIGKAEGFTFFIKDTIPGDRVKAVVMKLKKTYGFARLKEIIMPSPDRVEPPCPVHRACGGCQLMSMDYKAQLRFKEKKVKDSLTRIGGFSPEFVDSITSPIIGMTGEGESILRYRNKAQYPVGTDREGRIITGFYAGRTHSIIENRDCLLGSEENKYIIQMVTKYMVDAGLKPYDENTGKGIIRHILIRKGFYTGEIMVCLVVNADKLPMEDLLVDYLISLNKDSGLGSEGQLLNSQGESIHKIKSISININKNNTNVILGDKTRVIWGEPNIKDIMRGLTFNISAESFYQVNPVQTEKLYSKVKEYAGLTGNETVWDLYCGTGTIGLSLAKDAGKIYGIEVVPKAIEDAKKNAGQNAIKNVRFFVGTAEELFPQMMGTGNNQERSNNEGCINKTSSSSEVGTTIKNEDNITIKKPDIVIVDPPRKGCDERCLNTILDIAPEKVIYVSCDPATLARDLKILCDGGYKINALTPTDLFPNTVHVETVVLLGDKRVDGHIKLDVDVEKLDNTGGRATYAEIKDYVKEKYGYSISSLNIAQMKDKAGLEKRDNYNHGTGKTARVPQCTPEKEEAIMDAFRHFNLI